MKTNLGQKQLELLKGLRSQLSYHNLIGITGYPKSGDVLSFLRCESLSGELPDRQRNTSLDSSHSRQAAAGSEEADPGVTLTEIDEEIRDCKACDLYKQRIYAVPGKGPEKVRLMVIGDWLAADAGEQLPAGLLFGVEQDRMLGKMLEAINLPQRDVFITNVIKCALEGECQPQAVHVQSCTSFLRRQIATLMPEVICTMGMVAARALLERSQPLSRLRSQFHSYSVRQDMNIPVLATYHPTYLLQNPEMKRAAWMDLQLLAKKLGLQI